MNCEQIKPVLLEYVMMELPGADRDEIARHLETCSSCSEEAGKIRQTMGALETSATFEDVPQKIRVVSEPRRAWEAFWHAPARLAFAGGALACLAIAVLALAHTTVSYNQGNFEIAFGAAAKPAHSLDAQSPAAAPLSQPAAITPASVTSGITGGITREQVEKLIADAVAASEAKTSGRTAQIVKASAAQATADRMDDRREMAESFRAVQAAQVTMWKQQVQDQQYVSSLMRQSSADAARP